MNNTSKLTVSNLSYCRIEKTILEDISFEIPSGKFVGLLGPNGAGKSTLLKVMARFIAPNKGAVFFNEQSINRFNEKELAKKIAYMPQTTTVDFAFTVMQIVLMGRHPYIKRWKRETNHDYKIAEQAMRYTNISHLKDRYVNTLSGGERQLVFLARALAQETPFLFLDEPTSDLDIRHQVEICELISQLVREGKTVIAVIHDLNLAARYCDQLILLKNGQIIAKGAVESVFKSTHLEFSYEANTHIYRESFTDRLQLIPHIGKLKKRENEYVY